jgi:hypothetical protein
MARIDMKTDLNVAADEVWKLIGGFNTLPDWHPAIEKSELEEEGNMRRLSLAGGGTVVEKLVKLDDNERVYTYSIIDSPLPVKNYEATIRVKDDGEGHTTVEWSSEFEAEGAAENEAIDIIAGIYQTGFDNLKKIFGG